MLLYNALCPTLSTYCNTHLPPPQLPLISIPYWYTLNPKQTRLSSTPNSSENLHFSPLVSFCCVPVFAWSPTKPKQVLILTVSQRTIIKQYAALWQCISCLQCSAPQFYLPPILQLLSISTGHFSFDLLSVLFSVYSHDYWISPLIPLFLPPPFCPFSQLLSLFLLPHFSIIMSFFFHSSWGLPCNLSARTSRTHDSSLALWFY